MEPILLVGAGGHAKSCIDVIEQQGEFEIIGLVGLDNEVGSSVLGYPVVGTDTDLPALVNDSSNALVTIGQIKSPRPRIQLHDLLLSIGFNLARIISPGAYVSSHASIGAGTIIHHGAIVNASADIGDNCIINSRSLIEHDAKIDNHCHISTGAIINGHASIGMGCFVGSGCQVRESIVIGVRCVIGMGQRVTENCASDSTIQQSQVPS